MEAHIDAKDLRLLKINEIDSLPVPCILYRKDETTFRTVTITDEDMIKAGSLIKLVTRTYCKEKRIFIRINRPGKSFV